MECCKIKGKNKQKNNRNQTWNVTKSKKIENKYNVGVEEVVQHNFTYFYFSRKLVQCHLVTSKTFILTEGIVEKTIGKKTSRRYD